MTKDHEVLRRLAGKYMEIAASPIMDVRKQLWRKYMSMESSRPPISTGFGHWSAFMDDFLNLPEHRECENLLHYKIERELKICMFKYELGDDRVIKPYYSLRAVTKPKTDHDLMGVEFKKTGTYGKGHGYHVDCVIDTIEQARALNPGTFEIDEDATSALVDDIHVAFNGILDIDVIRGPFLLGFSGDCSFHYMNLRGLENMMTDPYLHPELHAAIMTYLQQRTLADHQAAEKDRRVTSSASIEIQGEGYCSELPDPVPGRYDRTLKDCWFFGASQELTSVSPDHFEQYMVQYQLPILKQFGLVHYGCCENLSNKMNALRKIPNLRRVAVTPSADLDLALEEIGVDYLISWRPNPGISVTVGYDIEETRKYLVENLEKLKGHKFDIIWKDIENDCGNPYNLRNSIAATRKALDDLGLA